MKNRFSWYSEDFLKVVDSCAGLVCWQWVAWDNKREKEQVFKKWLDESKPKSTAIWHLVRFANKQ